MNANEQLIESFYRAFSEKDHVSMGACYDPSIHFSDPVFTDLRGPEVTAMWHMLCEQGTDLEVTYSSINADDHTGSAHWDATYSFGPSRRVVHNSIDASFTFSAGRFVEHSDSFDLWKWSRMALGLPGVLTGWSGATQVKIRSTASRGLTRFIDEHPEYRLEQTAD